MLGSCFRSFLLFLALVLFQGCISDYELDASRTAGILAINGRITNDPGPHYVTLSRTSEKDQIAEPDSGAQMELQDDQGNSYPLYQEEPGTYVLPRGSAQIYPGHAYRLKVELRGQVYTTPFETMGEISAKDSISYRIEDFTQTNSFGNEVTSRVYSVYLDSQIDNAKEPQYFTWEAKEVYVMDIRNQLEDCYRDLKIDPQRINIQEAEGGFQMLASDELIARRPYNDPFRIKYWTVVNQYNISSAEYDYLRKVRLAIEQVGTIFNIPPGRVRGNFTNITNTEEIVYGYFSIALKSTTRFYLRRRDLTEVPSRTCLPSIPFFQLPGFCQCQNGVLAPDFFWDE